MYDQGLESSAFPILQAPVKRLTNKGPLKEMWSMQATAGSMQSGKCPKPGDGAR